MSEFTHQADAFDRAPVYRAADTLDRLVAALPLAAGQSWLDVACGTGIVSLALARHVGQVTGLDMTPAMLAQARASATTRGVPNARFIKGEASALPFPPRMFDGALTRFSLHHIPVPGRVVGQMAHAVRPGGWVALADSLTADDGGVAAWHQEIERLRDPSHWACLAPAAFFVLGRPWGLTLVSRQVVPFSLDFEEWLVRGSGGETHRPLIAELLAAAPPGSADAFAVTDDGRLHYRLGIAIWQRPEETTVKELAR